MGIVVDFSRLDRIISIEPPGQGRRPIPWQRDYRLKLRLGVGFDYSQMQAAIEDGVLTLSVPKRQENLAPAYRMGRVA